MNQKKRKRKKRAKKGKNNFNIVMSCTVVAAHNP